MASPQESVSMALFCDFENVALGVRDANYEKFDIKPILERLLLKGSIVVKKAYCDWDRYKGFKATMHEASFELIEIPHKRQSGKNSADIRLVVDALDLCYTKLHVDTFVIISGDSDFSPLVSKLRENAKKVIGVGVKNSTSDLLVANCDEFIFYDDLVREEQRAIAKREAREAREAAAAVAASAAAAAVQASAPASNANAGGRRSVDDEKSQSKQEIEARKSKAFAIAVETFDALVAERGDQGKIWASVLKNAIKRRKPDFSESYYGFRAFGSLLDEAQARGLLEVGRDEKSGAFVFRSNQQSGQESNASSSNAAATGAVGTPAHTQAQAPLSSLPPAPVSAQAPVASTPSMNHSQRNAMAVEDDRDSGTDSDEAPAYAQEQEAPRESSRSRSRRASRQKMRDRAIDAARQSPPISERSSEPGVGFDSVHNTQEAAHVADDLEAAVSGPFDAPVEPTVEAVAQTVETSAQATDVSAQHADTSAPHGRTGRGNSRAGRQGRRTPPSQAFGTPYQAPEPESTPAPNVTSGQRRGANHQAQAPLFDSAADAPVAVSVPAASVATPSAASAASAASPTSNESDAAQTPAAKPSPAGRARSAAAKKAALAEAEALSHRAQIAEVAATPVDAASAEGAETAKPARAPRKSVASTRRARARPIVVTED